MANNGALGVGGGGAGSQFATLCRAVGRSESYGLLAITGLAVVGVAMTIALAATDRALPSLLSSAAWAAFLAAGLVSACGLLWHVGRVVAMQRRTMEAARDALGRVEAEKRRLSEILDVIPLSMTLYDADERLVMFNAAYRSEPTYIKLDETLIGLKIEDMLPYLEPQFKAAYPDLEADWKIEYLRIFRAREGGDRSWADGRTMRLRQASTRSGGSIRLWVDVTDLKRNEAAAHAAQKRFDMLVSSLPDTVFSSDRVGRFNYLGGAPLLGFAPDEIVGRAARDVILPEDQHRVDECVARMRRNRGEPVSLTFRGVGKDGAVRYLEARVTAPNAEDNLDGELAITGTIRDIQAQHEMAERLRYELRRLDSVVQSTGARIVMVDRNMRIVMVNREVLDTTPRAAAALVGRPLRDVIRVPVDQSVFDAWFAAGPDEPINGIEYENGGPDALGRRRTYHVTANPVRDEQGQVQHIVFLAVDETERRAVELQLFAASRLATLGEMASGVAHEINQPLTIIRFGIENLTEQLQEMGAQATVAEVSELIGEKLSRMVIQTDRAATIIKDLKGFAGRSDEAAKPFDVSTAVAAAAQLLREQLRLSDVEVVLDLDPGCPAVIGSSARLQQVIMNLILNARDAIMQEVPVAASLEARHRVIRLRTWVEVSARKVMVSVEDDGPGIPDDILPRIFEPFFTTKPTGKGTGLGLSVSYQIIRQMGGAITAENRPGGGARFIVTLDAAPVGASAHD